MSCIFLFPLSYFLHDHFYFWKNKHSEQYINTIEKFLCFNLSKKGDDIKEIEWVLSSINDHFLIERSGKTIYEKNSRDTTDNSIVEKNNIYTCGDYNIHLGVYSRKRLRETYLSYFKALLIGEVFTKHKYWDFAVLHFSLILLFLSFILYRINAIQDEILTSIEQVIDNAKHTQCN